MAGRFYGERSRYTTKGGSIIYAFKSQDGNVVAEQRARRDHRGACVRSCRRPATLPGLTVSSVRGNVTGHRTARVKWVVLIFLEKRTGKHPQSPRHNLAHHPPEECVTYGRNGLHEYPQGYPQGYPTGVAPNTQYACSFPVPRMVRTGGRGRTSAFRYLTAWHQQLQQLRSRARKAPNRISFEGVLRA